MEMSFKYLLTLSDNFMIEFHLKVYFLIVILRDMINSTDFWHIV